VTGRTDARSPGLSHEAAVRRWALVGLVAQLAFVASWLISASWQGPHYSSLVHSMSDMYAVGAPYGAFLVVVFTLCGAATILFAWLSLRPALRPAGWTATVGSALLALSIYGLGDLLSPLEREGCRLADRGRAVRELGRQARRRPQHLGGVLFILAGFFLASAMKRLPGWRRWAWPARGVAVLFVVLVVATVLGTAVDLGGLFERLLAATGAAGIALLAAGVLQRSQA
jgi:hypothetical protein